MKICFFPRSLTASMQLCLLLCFAAFGVVAQSKDWKPVNPAELSQSKPSIEADADAEVLFWEVRVDDASPENMVMKHHVRVKVFTEKGREKYSKLDIPFYKGLKIKDIMARVIKADGSIVEITKADVFEREIAKTDKIKVKAKSFAVPNIDPGVIVEYKYTEDYSLGSADNLRMIFQHDVPVQSITYYFKPGADAKILSFNIEDSKFIKDKGGYYRITQTNVPALRSEPYMPPVDEVRQWLIVDYTSNLKGTAMDFWSRLGGRIVSNLGVKDTLKPGKDIKALAAEIVGGSTDPDERMAKLYEYCKTKLRNIDYDTSLTDEQKEELKPNKSTSDTLKKKEGTVGDINELFASLSAALGYETRLVFGGDRSEKFFTTTQAHESFIHFSAIAVKLPTGWKFYSPGDKFVPFGLLDWKEEDTAVLLMTSKDFLTYETPSSQPEQSMAKRKANLKLADDGTLEGTVRIEYNGHLSNQMKRDNYKLSDSQREDALKDSVKANMPNAEISSISIQNITDPEKPFVYEYAIKVPGYAQKTGKRLFLQPVFFEKGSPAAFSASERKYSVFFRHPWSESDEVTIEWPKAYELETPDIPRPLADSGQISSHKIDLAVNKENNSFVIKRNFAFGGRGRVLFSKADYVPLKSLFDAFHVADGFTLNLRMKQ